jgi:hypothetical protein
MTDQLPRHKPDQVAPKPGPTIVHMRPNLGHPDPEGFLEDLAAPAPTGAATKVDPTPAGVPDAMGASEPSAAPFGDPGAGSDAAGSGRPLRARDGRGRFIGTSRPRTLVPRPGQGGVEFATEALPVSVALEHALIDADAATFLATQHAKLRMARVVLDAIRFGVEADRLETALAVKAGMLVRLPGGDAA